MSYIWYKKYKKVICSSVCKCSDITSLENIIKSSFVGSCKSPGMWKLHLPTDTKDGDLATSGDNANLSSVSTVDAVPKHSLLELYNN